MCIYIYYIYICVCTCRERESTNKYKLGFHYKPKHLNKITNSRYKEYAEMHRAPLPDRYLLLDRGYTTTQGTC